MEINGREPGIVKHEDVDSEIYIKSRFYGWKPVEKDRAIECARHLFKGILTTKTDQETLDMVNAKFRGITFDLSDLR